MENQKENHQTSVVDMEGIISKQHVSILIDPRSKCSYVSP
jgi:hypothetical protein